MSLASDMRQGAALLAPADNTGMDLRKFLGHVLPLDGHFCLFHEADGYPKHEWFDSLEDLAQACEHHQDTTDLYFGTAAYAQPTKRKQGNVLALKSLRIDIDAGEKKYAKDPEGTYPDQRSAVIALNVAVKAGLPKPSIVLSSGEGVHAYWELAEPASPGEWGDAAAMLSALCKVVGLKVDTKVTRDTARILRPVGSLHNNGKRVGAVLCKQLVQEPYTLSSLKTAIAPSLPREDLFALAAERDKFAQSLNADILEVRSRPASIVKVAARCASIAWVRDTQGVVPEPVWRSFMGVAKYCEDGEQFVHEWSQGDSRYDFHETQTKFDRWEMPPATCESFSVYGKCKDCKYKGEVTTPKQLGELMATEIRATGGEPEAAPMPSRGAAKVEFPDWKRGDDGNKIGSPLNTVANVAALARIEGVPIRLNLMTRKFELTVPGMKAATDNADNTAMAVFGDMAVRYGMKRDGLAQLVEAVAAMHAYHPAVEALKAHSWDGTDRLPVFHRSLTLRDPATATFSHKLLDTFMLQGVKAWHSEQGFASQGMLVLAGPQGIGKTRWTQGLVPLYGAVRTGLNLDPTNKDSVLRATSCALAELGELDATFRRADIAGLKAFLTADQDVLRLPYALRESTFPRRTVFVGTVNGANFLYDDSGNRRFWTVAVTKCTPMSTADMLQVLAQYKHMLDAGASPYLDAATQAKLNESNKDHEAIDPLRERVLSAFDWSVVQQPGWLDLPGVTWATATDVCRHHLGIYEPTTAQATKVGAIVGSLNGEQRRRSNGQRTLVIPPRKGQ